MTINNISLKGAISLAIVVIVASGIKLLINNCGAEGGRGFFKGKYFILCFYLPRFFFTETKYISNDVNGCLRVRANIGDRRIDFIYSIRWTFAEEKLNEQNEVSISWNKNKNQFIGVQLI